MSDDLEPDFRSTRECGLCPGSSCSHISDDLEPFLRRPVLRCFWSSGSIDCSLLVILVIGKGDAGSLLLMPFILAISDLTMLSWLFSELPSEKLPVLPSSDVGVLVVSMLESIFIRELSFDLSFCGFGERSLVFDADRVRSIAFFLVLVLEGIDPPLLDFRTPFLRVLRTVRDTEATLSELFEGLLSMGDVFTTLPSCVSCSLSVDIIADSVDKCKWLLINTLMCN